MRSKIWDLFKFVVTVLVVVIPIRTWVAKPFIVSGASMYPTFHDREYLIVDELSYNLRPPERGEVIVFKYPEDPSKYFIKRIIGLPGETIKINDSRITIEKGGAKQELIEPYIKENFEGKVTMTLDDGQYFVMGDNRNVSLDSRSWGALPEELISGRAFVRLFPFNRFGVLPGNFSVNLNN